MKFVSIFLLAIFCLVGCGAIMHGTDQEITFNSSPTEAKVIVNGEDRTTPATFNLSRKNTYIVKISKEGFETAEVIINKKLDWTAWMDLLVWGVIPIFYDLSSGAAYHLDPDKVNVSLQRSGADLGIPETLPVALELKDGCLTVTGDGLTISVTPIE